MNQVQKKVLIVEDDPHISRVYEIQLMKEGLLTVIAHNGEDALKLAEDENPDLVVLDLMIPKKDGFWVLEEIRKEPKFSKIPILIISNLGQNDDKKRALDLGATEYLIKVDQSIQKIIDKIKEYLKI